MSQERKFDEAVAKEILRRAAELELRTDSMTESEIRSIAQELGVTQRAVDDAIDEYDHNPWNTVSGASNWRRRLGTRQDLPILCAAAGLASGTFMLSLTGLMPQGTDFGGIGLLMTAIPYLLIVSSVQGERRHALFQKSNFALWAVFFSMALALKPRYLNDILEVGGVVWLVTSVMGALVIERRNEKSSMDAPNAEQNPGLRKRFWRSMTRRLEELRTNITKRSQFQTNAAMREGGQSFI
jgi:hypothetical protein